MLPYNSGILEGNRVPKSLCHIEFGNCHEMPKKAWSAGGIDTLHGSAGNDTLDGGRDWTKDNMYGEGDGDVFRKHRYPFGETSHIIEPETDDYQSRTGDTYQVVDNSIVVVPVIKPGLMISIKK